jgi:hypothetical protein
MYYRQAEARPLRGSLVVGGGSDVAPPSLRRLVGWLADAQAGGEAPHCELLFRAVRARAGRLRILSSHTFPTVNRFSMAFV